MLSAESAPVAVLSDRYREVRARTLSLIAELQPEDTVVQTMPDVSPTKWHLAHVTWFFERFVLKAFATDYSPFDESYDYLFNSYYHTVGHMHARPERGLLSRPTLAQVLDYRAHVDSALLKLLGSQSLDDNALSIFILGTAARHHPVAIR